MPVANPHSLLLLTTLTKQWDSSLAASCCWLQQQQTLWGLLAYPSTTASLCPKARSRPAQAMSAEQQQQCVSCSSSSRRQGRWGCRATCRNSSSGGRQQDQFPASHPLLLLLLWVVELLQANLRLMLQLLPVQVQVQTPLQLTALLLLRNHRAVL